MLLLPKCIKLFLIQFKSIKNIQNLPLKERSNHYARTTAKHHRQIYYEEFKKTAQTATTDGCNKKKSKLAKIK
jgi:hypothetical protein